MTAFGQDDLFSYEMDHLNRVNNYFQHDGAANTVLKSALGNPEETSEFLKLESTQEVFNKIGGAERFDYGERLFGSHEFIGSFVAVCNNREAFEHLCNNVVGKPWSNALIFSEKSLEPLLKAISDAPTAFDKLCENIKAEDLSEIIEKDPSNLAKAIEAVKLGPDGLNTLFSKEFYEASKDIIEKAPHSFIRLEEAAHAPPPGFELLCDRVGVDAVINALKQEPHDMSYLIEASKLYPDAFKAVCDKLGDRINRAFDIDFNSILSDVKPNLNDLIALTQYVGKSAPLVEHLDMLLPHLAKESSTLNTLVSTLEENPIAFELVKQAFGPAGIDELGKENLWVLNSIVCDAARYSSQFATWVDKLKNHFSEKSIADSAFRLGELMSISTGRLAGRFSNLDPAIAPEILWRFSNDKFAEFKTALYRK